MASKRIVFLDTETTGLSPHKGNHRVIDIACIEYIDKKPSGRVLQSILCAGNKPSNKNALKVHGITDESRMNKPEFESIADNLLEFLEDCHLIIYNKAFDIGFIESEFRLLGKNIHLDNHCHKISCAMELAKQTFNTSRISLDAACKRYRIDLSNRKQHGAYIDADLTAQLYFKLTDKAEKPLSRTPHTKPQRKPKAVAIPRAFKHPKNNKLIQLNYCKNADCKNFGIPAKNPNRNSDGTPKRGLGNDYKLTHNKDGTHSLTCSLCNQSSILINNRAYIQESLRIKQLLVIEEPSCGNTEQACKNVGKGIYTYPEKYKKNGFTRKTRQWVVPYVTKGKNGGKPRQELKMQPMYGSQRYQCKLCKKNFSVVLDPQQKHYRRDINEPLFLAFVNKGIVNRQIEVLDVNPQTIYDKIDFFYHQALTFARFYEFLLPECLAQYTPILSCDRQYYLSNWNDTNSPMPSRIVNTSTVDNITGYTLASTVNFDPNSDAKKIKSEHQRKKEYLKARYYRRFGQYILNDEDIELPTDDNYINVPLQMPRRGLLVHQTYSTLAHFERIKSFLRKCDQVIYFLDNDSGFSTMCPAVFHDMIKSEKLHAYMVTTEKNGGANLLDKGMADELNSRLNELKREYPDESERQLWQRMWKIQYKTPVTQPGSRSEWLVNPNTKSRFVGIHPLSGTNRESIELASSILQDTSLNGVDNWFQILRRLINMLERPPTSATNSKRWNAYAGYNPTWMSKLIEIMRVYNNFCRTNEKSLLSKKDHSEPTTAAQRLGITDKAYTASDILSFSVHSRFSDVPKHISNF
ncbi:hypothetical protein tinsulaeT_13110 [Thalassotalea insulae]|uniref:DNA-directed DNA polymerase n=1 Tax=Thalassotalea insulae TaxID=2056778 RepID=A0ABQ6GTF8_9GAMM|nr:exonuclease domain-containing protein [Thalassotalea insulae]GLX77971.1 hypothetical protein tinsulaeT_13110 [Thalassotalea insulae]